MTPADLANHMRQWRAGLSTTEAGELLGLSRRTIEGIEQGKRFKLTKLLLVAMDAVRRPPDTTPSRVRSEA